MSERFNVTDISGSKTGGWQSGNDRKTGQKKDRNFWNGVFHMVCVDEFAATFALAILRLPMSD
jgi:hypothetical protein